ncbi:MAG: DUF4139 domain-containing protein [Alphaproteobacteria bacterium]|nr:DUF4139 domain-containing protein [Alphaproteobacteria bacterium]MCW5739915.1 DUF4139 domain-containing protein [Alphaproteobacteria bacterium]
MSASTLAQELALKRVMLSSGGVGYFEYEVSVEGDASLKLTVGLDQVDDVLKSLVVYDDKGGVGGLNLAGREPLSQTFKDLPFDQGALGSPAALLNALRGAEISVGGARAMTGRVVAVTPETVMTPDRRALQTRNRVTMMTDKGLQQFVLEEAENLQFADPALREQVQRALAAVANNRAKDARTIELTSKGKDRRTVRVAYIVSAPLWKASYRLTMPSDDAATKAQLQGWAVVENLSGQDWKNVELTLVSGQPVMFRQALYRAYYVDRPEAPVEVVGRLLPNVDQGQTPYPPPPPAPASAPAPRMAPGAPAQSRADGRAVGMGGAADRVERTLPTNLAVPAESVAAQEALTQVLFRFPTPVTVGNGRTLSVPIINGDVPIKRQALYQPETSPRNPLASVRLMNDGGSGLPPGVITIYERHGAPGSGDITYVGDARLAALPPGENRLLSYALDQKISVERESARTDTLVRGSISGGVLKYETLQRQTATYRVRAPAREGRQLLIENPKLSGWKLTKPVNPDIGQIEGKYRVPFDLKGGEVYSFEIVQEQTVSQQLALVSADVEQVRYFARAREFDQKTRDALGRLIQLQGAVVAASKVLGELDGQRQRIVQEQARIRDNLGRVPSGTDLHRRYLATLDRQETELEALAKRRGEAETAVQAARDAVSKYVAGLG